VGPGGFGCLGKKAYAQQLCGLLGNQVLVGAFRAFVDNNLAQERSPGDRICHPHFDAIARGQHPDGGHGMLAASVFLKRTRWRSDDNDPTPSQELGLDALDEKIAWLVCEEKYAAQGLLLRSCHDGWPRPKRRAQQHGQADSSQEMTDIAAGDRTVHHFEQLITFARWP
jgi:hypothetical protein